MHPDCFCNIVGKDIYLNNSLTVLCKKIHLELDFTLLLPAKVKPGMLTKISLLNIQHML